jgi:hypothetical protein
LLTARVARLCPRLAMAPGNYHCGTWVGRWGGGRFRLLSRTLQRRCAGARLPPSVGAPPWASCTMWCALKDQGVRAGSVKSIGRPHKKHGSPRAALARTAAAAVRQGLPCRPGALTMQIV